MSFLKLASFFVLSATITVVGCSTQMEGEEEEEGTDSSESDLSGARSVALKYEGTCAFLKNCSSYSRNLPANKVAWGCTGVGICSDSALWVAGPNRSYCGKTVKICKGSTCADALVKDVSISRDWEASNGVLDALNLPHGLNGRCSGFGGGRVTVSVGGRSASTEAPDPGTSNPPATNADNDPPPAQQDPPPAQQDPPPPPPPAGDNGCFSASLQQDVAELTCVVSKKTGGGYQCKAGLWYRGVSGTTGPYGECLNGEVRSN